MREAADRAGGQALLRIEDIDQGRCRPEYEAAIHEDLAWLGLRWDGEVRRQSDHFGDYVAVIDGLAARGLVYRCFRSRQDIAAETGAQPDTPFTGAPLAGAEEAARLARGEPFAWRLSLSRALDALGAGAADLAFTVETGPEKSVQIRADPHRFGDIALTRKDSPVAYHLAACHDDALQAITHVIRGEDLIDAPHIHTLLQALMGWPHPVYRHHRLLTGPDGKRFAKRDRSRTVSALRAEGHSAEAVRAMAGLA